MMALMKEWSGGKYAPLTFEAKTSSVVYPSDSQRQAGLFLSGGIDALAALRINNKVYPKELPGHVKDCLLVHGFDVGASLSVE